MFGCVCVCVCVCAVCTEILVSVLCFLLGNSPASEFYMPTFRNAVSVPSS